MTDEEREQVQFVAQTLAKAIAEALVEQLTNADNLRRIAAAIATLDDEG